MSAELTPAMHTVLREASDEWKLTHAHRNTVEALERRGLVEAQCRGRYGLDLFMRRTQSGRDHLNLLNRRAADAR